MKIIYIDESLHYFVYTLWVCAVYFFMYVCACVCVHVYIHIGTLKYSYDPLQFTNKRSESMHINRHGYLPFKNTPLLWTQLSVNQKGFVPIHKYVCVNVKAPCFMGEMQVLVWES